MQFKQLIALTYAITAAGVAIGLNAQYNRSLQEYYGQYMEAKAAPTPELEMSSVLTVKRDLPYGHRLTREDFVETAWPAHTVPTGALRSVNEVFNGAGDKFVRGELVEGELVLANKISAAGSGSALSLMLKPGMRAVTIQTNEVRGVGGFVQPNDNVDILLTELQESKDATKAGASRVILQNIRVLAMGQELRSGFHAKVARSATVAVTLEDAQKLALATSIGQISLALRNPRQKAVGGLREVSLKDLSKPKKAARRGKMEVVVHRTTTRTVERYSY